jgi:hypothetical protein
MPKSMLKYFYWPIRTNHISLERSRQAEFNDNTHDDLWPRVHRRAIFDFWPLTTIFNPYNIYIVGKVLSSWVQRYHTWWPVTSGLPTGDVWLLTSDHNFRSLKDIYRWKGLDKLHTMITLTCPWDLRFVST